MEAFAERLADIQAKIERALAKSGRLGGVELVAVSKTHPPEAVAEALAAGQILFGESRVQEARAKIAEVSGHARWHFIGRLQRNKVRQALPLFELIHSVDTLEIAREIDRIASEEGLRPRILLEVNLAGEASKLGFRPSALQEQFEALLSLSRITLEGLMTLPPPAPDAEGSRRYFSELRTLREELQSRFGVGLPVLSMGMSSDFPVAIEEGATLVRVGSALFGSRQGKTWRPGPE